MTDQEDIKSKLLKNLMENTKPSDPIQSLMMMKLLDSFEEKKKGFDIEDIIKYKMLQDMIAPQKPGKDEDDVSSAIRQALNAKIIKEIMSSDDDKLDKFMKYLAEKEQKEKEDKRDEELQQMNESLQGQIELLKRQIVERLNSLDDSGKDWMSKLREFNELKQEVTEAYKLLSPEQKQNIPPPNEDWTPNDYVNAAKELLNAIPTLTSTVQAIVGRKPPKKQFSNDIPADLKNYIEGGREENGIFYGPDGKMFTNTDTGEPLSKAEIIELTKTAPNEMRKAFSTPPQPVQEEPKKAEPPKKPEPQNKPKPPVPENIPEPEPDEQIENADAEQETVEKEEEDTSRIGEDISEADLNEEEADNGDNRGDSESS